MNALLNSRLGAPYAAVVAIAAAGALTMPLPVSWGALVDAGDHNARVAEYLLEHRLVHSEHNARVAEYLLLRHQNTDRHNAYCAECSASG